MPDRLLNGYRRFRATEYRGSRGRYEQLARFGQVPIAMVIACSDSRVLPQTVFDAGPGDLFLVRNVANLVPPPEPDGGYHGTSAAIEYAVRHLLVPTIVVLGHSHCGGIHAYLDGAHDENGESTFITRWMDMLDRADPPLTSRIANAANREHAAELEAVRISLANLKRFDCVIEAVDEGRLTVHGAHFDLGSGILTWLDEATGAFKPVE